MSSQDQERAEEYEVPQTPEPSAEAQVSHLTRQVADLLAERADLHAELARVRKPIPPMPRHLIEAVELLPDRERGLATGFAAAGWVAAWQAMEADDGG